MILVSAPAARGQSGDRPSPPDLRLVTVDTSSMNDVIIRWEHSPSPGIQYYVIFRGLGDQQGEAIDTADASVNTYVHYDAGSSGEPVSYSVKSRDSLRDSYFTEFHKTMYTRISWDSCESVMNLSWTAYEGWEDSLLMYSIYRKPAGGSYGLTGTRTPEFLTFPDITIQEDEDYCYFVEARHKDRARRSYSNIVCKNTRLPDTPDFIHADYATVNNNAIDLSFTLDTSAEVQNYRLLRTRDPAKPFEVLTSFTDVQTGKIQYNDPVLSILNQYFYRLSSLNTCMQADTFSNLAGNIVLNVSNNDLQNTLVWTSYQNWPAGIKQYNIYRITDQDNIEMIASVEPPDTVFADHVNELVNQGKSSNICYYVEAEEEEGNPYGTKGYSKSNRVCVTIKPQIFMANAFTPNQDGLNDNIKPIITFYPKSYYFVIFDRYGSRIFETENPDEAWNGRNANNKMAEQGVYLYYVKITTSTDVVVEKKGHLTLVVY